MAQEQEIDKDLTMIQPPKSQSSRSIEELIKSGKNLGGIGGDRPTSKREALALNTQLQAADMTARSITHGVVDPELDAGQSMFEDTNTVRARNQSTVAKGFKAVGSGVLQGGLVALEQLGYMADVEQHLNMLTTADDFSGNWWSDLMKQGQEGIAESETFKIYEDGSDPNSVASSIFKWKSLESAISSAVGYGLSGLGTAKLVSAIGNTKKFAQLAAFTDKTMGNLFGVGAEAMAGSTRAFVGPFATAAMSEYFQGQMMATESFKASMEAMSSQIKSGKLSQEAAEKIANDNALDVVGLNMLLSVTGQIKFGSIFQKTKKLNGLADNPSALNEVKKFVTHGAPTEFAEEITQELFQMEQEYDTLKESGQTTKYSGNHWDRMSQMLLSNRALQAGAMGIAGGPLQFAIIQAPFSGDRRAAQRETYNNQQSSLEWHKQVVANNFNTFKEFDKATKEAILDGKIGDAEFYTDLGFIDKIAHSAEWGTIGYLKDSVEKIINMSPEEATALGYDENYVETATKAMETVDKASALSRQYSGYHNPGEIVFNRLAFDQVNSKLESLRQEESKTRAKLEKDIEATLGIPSSRLDSKLRLIKDPNLTTGTADENIANKKAYAKESDRLDNFLGSNPYFTDFEDARKELGKYEKLSKDLGAKFNTLTDPAYQAKSKKEEENKIKNLNSAVTEKKIEEDKNAAIDGLTKFRKFDDVRKEKPEESEEARAIRLEGYAKDTEGRALTKKDTFSSIDSFGNHRIYTPKDIVRSYDGRMFKVEKQLTVKNQFNEVEGAGMPILYEVDANGKWIKKEGTTTFMEQWFVLGSNDFLRPEVLQQKQYGKGPISGYEAKWAPYVQPDSLLKPKDATYQVARQAMLAKGHAKSINMSAKFLLGDKAPEWTSEYALADLDLPFSGEYEVEFKMRNEGEGQKYVDVYKTDSNGNKILLTRLDKNYNLNYTIITDALAKGPVTGKVVEHYSSGKNIVKLLGEDGRPIQRSIAEIANMNPAYLPNGKLILAQTKGHGAHVKTTLDVAADTEGNVYNNTIPVEVNGEIVEKEIPYTSMYAGNTYVLLLSPSGRIVPIATASQQIDDIKNPEGGSMVDTVIQEFYNSINSVFKEELFNQEREDKLLRETIENNIEIKEGEKDKKFAIAKFEKLKDKEEAFQESLENTVAKHIRQKRKFYIDETQVNSKGETVSTKAMNSKKEVLYNEKLLLFTYAVSKTTGNIVPAVKVRNPRNHAKTATYNLEDHEEQFKTIIGQQFKVMSIDDLVTPIQDGVNKVQELVSSGNLTTDINISKPFAGSSATIQIDGEDITANSAELLTKLNFDFDKDFGEDAKELTKYLSQEKKEEALEAFTQTILDFTTPGEHGGTVEDVSFGTEDEIIEFSEQFVQSLRIKENTAAVTMMKNTVLTSPVDGDEEVLLSAIIETLEEMNIVNNTELVAKVVLGLGKIQEAVESGKFNLMLGKATKSNNPKFDQPEGHGFSVGSRVYNPLFGNGTVSKVRKDGMYQVKFPSRKAPVNLYPADVYIFEGKQHKLALEQKQLAKVPEGDPRRIVLERNILKLQNDLERNRQLREGTLVLDKKDASASVGTSKGFSSVLSAIDAVDLMVGIGSVDSAGNYVETIGGLSDEKKEMLERALLTDRGEQLNAAIMQAQTIVDSIKRDSKDSIELEKLRASMLTLNNVIFYSNEELDTLQALAESTGNNKVLAATKSLRVLKEAVSDTSDAALTKERMPIELFIHNKEKGIRKDSVEYPSLTIEGMPTSEGAIVDFNRKVISTLLNVFEGETILRAELFASTKKDSPAKTPTIMDSSVSFEDIENIEIKFEPLTPTVDGSWEKAKPINDELEKRFKDSLKEGDKIITGNNETIFYRDGKIVKKDGKDYGMTDIPTRAILINGAKIVRTNKITPPTVKKQPAPAKVIAPSKKQPKAQDTSDARTAIATTLSAEVVSRLTDSQAEELLPYLPLATKEQVSDLQEEIKSLVGMGMVDNIQDSINAFTEQFPKFKQENTVLTTPEQFQQEIEDVKKMLPQVPIEVVTSVAEMHKKFGTAAVGAFYKGVRYLVNQANVGTAYHETFHAVADLYLSKEEKQAIADERGYSSWNLDLEEKLADEFETYAKANKTKTRFERTLDKVKTFFNNLLSWNNNVRSADVVTKVFDKIVTGGYAVSKSVTILENHDSGFNSIDDFKSRLSEENAVILQQLLDKNMINIVC